MPASVACSAEVDSLGYRISIVSKFLFLNQFVRVSGAFFQYKQYTWSVIALELLSVIRDISVCDDLAS